MDGKRLALSMSLSLLAILALSLVFITLTFTWAAVSPMTAEEKPGAGEFSFSKKVILVTMDKVSYEELLHCSGPLLRSLLKQSAVALMNANTADSPGTEGGYLTLSSGARLRGNPLVRLAFNRDESWHGVSAQSLYRRHTGAEEAPPGEIIHPYWSTLVRLNEGLPYPAKVGALGETLEIYGLAAAVLGNADGDTPGRQAVSIAMNSRGTVAHGCVGPLLLRADELFPFGFRCNAAAYMQALQKVWPGSSLIVIEWGDTGRIDAYREQLSRDRREQLLRLSFAELDLFLKDFLPYLEQDNNALLIFVSPSPSLPGAKQRMTPLVLFDPSRREGGMLRSATTRREGIIANIDIAPTVLSHLELDAPFFFFGAPLEVVPFPSPHHLTELSRLSLLTARIYQQRPPVIRGFIFSLIVFTLLVALAVITRMQILYSLRYLSCILLNFPVVLLLAPAAPPFPAAGVYESSLLLILISFPVIIPAFFFMRRNMIECFAFSGLVACALLLFDLWQGSPLSSRSLLGYDPIGGARFYGMGNEYMGVLLGSFILGFFSLFSLLWRRLHSFKTSFFLISGASFAVVAVLIIYFMASPRYGANFGGTITAGVALAVTLSGYLFLTGPLGLREMASLRQRLGAGKIGYNMVVLPSAFMAVAVLLLFLLNDPAENSTVSHLGRNWELIRSHGLTELGNVALRKMEMNLKLIRYSLWTRVLLGVFALLSLLYYYPVGLMHSIFQREPFFKAILGGTLGASAVAFLVNDSGVVAASTVILYGGLPLFCLALREVFSYNGVK